MLRAFSNSRALRPQPSVSRKTQRAVSNCHLSVRAQLVSMFLGVTYSKIRTDVVAVNVACHIYNLGIPLCLARLGGSARLKWRHG
jgi:hypothetical protein